MSNYKSLQDRLDYHFDNLALLGQAFIAAGAPMSRCDVEGPTKGNKRLALVGDAVLRLCVLGEWYPDGTDIETGHELVKDVGMNDKLKDIAKDWNLTEYLKENPCQKGEEPKTTLASTVEAIIRAVWIDSKGDLGAVQQVIKKFQS